MSTWEATVQYRTIGRSGLKVSTLGLGTGSATFCGRLERDEALDLIREAVDLGVTYFDTAETYAEGRAEELLGAALAGRRDEVVLATKFGKDRSVPVSEQPGSRRRIMAAAEGSLRRLGTDRIDLYILHEPDPVTPIEETLGALSELARDGLIREFGCSNVGVAQLEEAAAAVGDGRSGFVSVQNDYNLLNRKMELDVLPYCASTGLAFTAYFPIYHGLLTGHFHRGEELKPGSRLATAHPRRQEAAFTDEHFDVLEGLAAFAEARGRTVLDVALARLLAEPGLAAVLPGAASAQHVQSNANAATMQLNAAEIAEIDRIAPTVAGSPDTPSSENGYPV